MGERESEAVSKLKRKCVKCVNLFIERKGCRNAYSSFSLFFHPSVHTVVNEYIYFCANEYRPPTIRNGLIYFKSITSQSGFPLYEISSIFPHR